VSPPWDTDTGPTRKKEAKKVKYTLEEVTKAQRGSRGISLHFL
jgi:hypothetical protein